MATDIYQMWVLRGKDTVQYKKYWSVLGSEKLGSVITRWAGGLVSEIYHYSEPLERSICDLKGEVILAKRDDTNILYFFNFIRDVKYKLIQDMEKRITILEFMGPEGGPEYQKIVREEKEAGLLV